MQPDPVARPAADPASGTVKKNTAVALTCDTPGAVIHYTLDGTEPTGDSPIYTAPLLIDRALTLKALAVKPAMGDSEVLTVSYTLAEEPRLVPEKPTATLRGETVADGDSLTPGALVLATSTPGAELWYTTNGVCPKDDPAPIRYTGPIPLTPGTWFFRIRARLDGVWSDGLPLHLTVAEQPPENPFMDVTQGKFYYDPVLWAVSRDPQITNGVDDTHFQPDKTCTRAQVVTFLWRAAGCPQPTGTTHPFTDVKEGGFYYTAMLWAVEQGITTGTGKTTFSPNDGCTRAQVVTFLHRVQGEPDPTGAANPFTDVKEAGFYYTAMRWAVEQGITKGLNATTFGPGVICTRGQIVTFLYREMMG